MNIPKTPPKFKDILSHNPSAIFKLLNNKQVQDFIKHCNKKYHPWEVIRYKQLPEGTTHEQIWVLIKFFRTQQFKHFKFADWNFVYSILDETLFKLHTLDKGAAGHIKSELDMINPDGRDKYIISSLMEEAIASSQLEGAATTRKMAKEMLRSNRKPRTVAEQMILNGYLTMQKIVKLKDSKLTPALLLEIQEEITRDTLTNKSDEGRFRDSNEIVVADPTIIEKIYYTPPEHLKIPELIEKLCEFANTDDENEFIHPVIKGIFLHFLIGYIHPFNDGNGRTARTIFYWYVLKKGYWLFEYMSISRMIVRSKKNYGLAYLYSETDDNDLTYFINFNLTAIEDALNEMEKYMAIKQKEHAEALRLLRKNPELNPRQADILKNIIRNQQKNITINEIMTTYGVVYETARTDLLLLERLGYAKKIVTKHKFYFEFIPNKDTRNT